LCKPRIILFLKHFIKFFCLGFHIRGRYIVNHKQDLVLNFRWRSLGAEENELDQFKLCILPRESTPRKTIAIPTSIGLSLCPAAATRVSIFKAAPNPVVYECCRGKPTKEGHNINSWSGSIEIRK
jgi:hypothetical protein